MADKATGIFAGLKAGSEFNIRGADGTELVARVEDLEYVPGDETHRPMLRGHIELRNFAYPPDAHYLSFDTIGESYRRRMRLLSEAEERRDEPRE